MKPDPDQFELTFHDRNFLDRNPNFSASLSYHHGIELHYFHYTLYHHFSNI